MSWNNVIFIGLLFLLGAEGFAESGRSEIGQLLFYQGTVAVDGKKALEPISLKVGSVIETGHGHATVSLGSNHVIDMDADSRLRVVELKEKESKSQLQKIGAALERGQIRGAREIGGSDSSGGLQVVTPVGLFQLDGGRYTVGVSASNEVSVLAVDAPGNLVISSPDKVVNQPAQLKMTGASTLGNINKPPLSTGFEDYRKEYLASVSSGTPIEAPVKPVTPSSNFKKDEDQEESDKSSKEKQNQGHHYGQIEGGPDDEKKDNKQANNIPVPPQTIISVDPDVTKKGNVGNAVTQAPLTPNQVQLALNNPVTTTKDGEREPSSTTNTPSNKATEDKKDDKKSSGLGLHQPGGVGPTTGVPGGGLQGGGIPGMDPKQQPTKANLTVVLTY